MIPRCPEQPWMCNGGLPEVSLSAAAALLVIVIAGGWVILGFLIADEIHQLRQLRSQREKR